MKGVVFFGFSPILQPVSHSNMVPNILAPGDWFRERTALPRVQGVSEGDGLGIVQSIAFTVHFDSMRLHQLHLRASGIRSQGWGPLR